MRTIRSYIAGLGTGASLAAAAAAVFIALGAIVSFDRTPEVANVSQGQIQVNVQGPEAAAAAAADPTAAPSPTASPETAVVTLASAPGMTPAAEPTDAAGSSGSIDVPTDAELPDPAIDTVTPSPASLAPGPVPASGEVPAVSRMISGVTAGLDGTVANVTGIDPRLDKLTGPLADVVDGLIDDLTKKKDKVLPPIGDGIDPPDPPIGDPEIDPTGLLP